MNMKQTLTCLSGDSLEVLKEYKDNHFDSVVTDPPYGLSFMGKKWDYDVPSIEIWKEVLRVLKPGGHLVSFSSSRTYHRMTVNVEDAGFEVRDQLMWLYGSGFPKSHNIGKSYDKKIKGNTKKISQNNDYEGTNALGRSQGRCPKCNKFNSAGQLGSDCGTEECYVKEQLYSRPDNQYAGWGTALKPAHEPIVLARKPLTEKTIVDNVIKWGTGGINIDGSRVGTDKITIGGIPANNRFDAKQRNKDGTDAYEASRKTITNEGRFPANIIHDGSPEVLEGFPYTKSVKAKVGVIKGASYDNKQGGKGENILNAKLKPTIVSSFEDEGSAARFFYCAKVGKKERNAGVLNQHPTVKPIALMVYLINLITPVGGVVLDPFMGSGSTGMAAKEQGYSFTGIDLDEGYVEIAQARIESW